MNRRGLLKWMGISPLSGLLAKTQPSEDLESRIIDTLKLYMDRKCYPKLSSISVNDKEYIFRFNGFIETQSVYENVPWPFFPIELAAEVVYPRKEAEQYLDLKKIDTALEKRVMFIKDETIFTISRISP